jgi:hypothetical protein
VIREAAFIAQILTKCDDVTYRVLEDYSLSLIFLVEKIPQHAFLRRGNKAVGPMYVVKEHVKAPKSDVEVATLGKILGNFSPIVPPSAAGVRSRRFRRGGHLVAGVGTF